MNRFYTLPPIVVMLVAAGLLTVATTRLNGDAAQIGRYGQFVSPTDSSGRGGHSSWSHTRPVASCSADRVPDRPRDRRLVVHCGQR